jgi:hypothetical protein
LKKRRPTIVQARKGYALDVAPSGDLSVQPHLQKYFYSHLTQITGLFHAVTSPGATVLRVRPAIGRPQGWRCRAPAFGG